jgi:hypothetical protein
MGPVNAADSIFADYSYLHAAMLLVLFKGVCKFTVHTLSDMVI